MILFGAGASVPFDIPTMSEFVIKYEDQCNEKESLFYEEIKSNIKNSDKTIGYSLEFDLESLLAILNDLSDKKIKKPISAATASFLINKKINFFQAKKEYNKISSTMLLNLKELIFNECIKPIAYGKKEGNISFLDKFYGPLTYLINKGEFIRKERGLAIRDIFSTNWDLCFKEWATYNGSSIYDGMKTGSSGHLFLNITDLKNQVQRRLEDQRSQWQGIHTYIPLHGSIDYFYYDVLKKEGSYTEIRKHPDPISYYRYKENLKNMFIIYPLEAIGYEETIKSPYLDMLYLFSESLMTNDLFYIIGHSLRDPTISSIIEDRLEKKIDQGRIEPLSDNLEKRIEQSTQIRDKIIIFTRDAEKLKKDLKRRGHNLLSQTFIPIETTFPKILDFNNDYIINDNFEDDYSLQIKKILNTMRVIFPKIDMDKIASEINNKYNLNI